ncbi:MAG: hypothetical protein O2960_28010 [Verrucomicrobia bacterium]|nr:hypothetical protein [Verrucomicrobiota bacterium]
MLAEATRCGAQPSLSSAQADPLGGSGYTDGTASAARFSLPSGIAVDSAGNVYVADRENSTIRKVTALGVVTTLAGLAGRQSGQRRRDGERRTVLCSFWRGRGQRGQRLRRQLHDPKSDDRGSGDDARRAAGCLKQKIMRTKISPNGHGSNDHILRDSASVFTWFFRRCVGNGVILGVTP